jgi:HSP20 family protein
MTISRWEPFKELMTLRQAMDRLFEDSLVRPGRYWAEGSGTANLPLDVFETKDSIVVRASLPGIKPEDVDISVEGNTLTIRGETRAPTEESNYLMQEHRYGPFARSLELGMPIEAEKAEASFTNGVLVLTIPKAEEAKPRVIKVNAAGQK